MDVLVEVATLVEYHWLSEQLRQLGFVEDTSEDVPICRWKTNDVILDVMPTDPEIYRSTLIIDRLKALAGLRSFKGGAISPDHS